MPLAVAVDNFYTADVFMHSWDLAQASGQDLALDEDQCAAMLAGMAPDGGDAAWIGASTARLLRSPTMLPRKTGSWASSVAIQPGRPDADPSTSSARSGPATLPS